MAPEVENIKFASVGRERRQHDRFTAELPVTMRLVGGSAATKSLDVIHAVTRDVSEGGLYIELGDRFLTPAKNLAIDNFLIFRSDLELELNLPTQTIPVRAVGKSVWIEKKLPGKSFRHGIAITFKSIDDNDLKVLRQFLALVR